MLKKLTAYLLILSFAFTMTSCEAEPEYEKIKVSEDGMYFDATPEQLMETYNLLSPNKIEEFGEEIYLLTHMVYLDNEKEEYVSYIKIKKQEDEKKFHENLKAAIKCFDYGEKSSDEVIKLIEQLVSNVDKMSQDQKFSMEYYIIPTPREPLGNITIVCNHDTSVFIYPTKMIKQREKKYYTEDILEQLEKNPKYALDSNE